MNISHKIAKIVVFFGGCLTGVTMFFVAYGGVPILFAQDGTGKTGLPSSASTPTVIAPVAPISPLDQSCRDALPAVLEKEKNNFINFMNQHFKNEMPNSALLNTGLQALNHYKNTILAAEKRFLLQSKRQADAITEIASCDAEVQKQFVIADSVFQSFVIQTASSKKSTALTEKLHSINGKLRTLLTQTEQFDAYFTSFSKRLPGYVTTTCIKKDG